jgi:hypothetical protein
MSADSVLRPRPSVLWVLLFGWVVLLIRGALVRREAVCQDCGARRRYRSAESNLALAILGVLVLLVAWIVIEDLG